MDAESLPALSKLLQRRHRPCDVGALLGFFDGLRALFHSFLNPNPFALKNRERMLAQYADGKRAMAAPDLIHAGDAKGVSRFGKGAGISQQTVAAQNLRGFGN